jgi:hypothetical protein
MKNSNQIQKNKIAAKWAAMVVLTSILLTYILQYSDVDQSSPVKLLIYLPFAAYLLFAQSETRERQKGYISFNTAFATGFRCALFSALTLAIFTLLYLSILSPQVMEQLLAGQRDKLASQGISGDQADNLIEMSRKIGPIIKALTTALGLLLSGSIIAAIGALILKKELSPADIEKNELELVK